MNICILRRNKILIIRGVFYGVWCGFRCFGFLIFSYFSEFIRVGFFFCFIGIVIGIFFFSIIFIFFF